MPGPYVRATAQLDAVVRPFDFMGAYQRYCDSTVASTMLDFATRYINEVAGTANRPGADAQTDV